MADAEEFNEKERGEFKDYIKRLSRGESMKHIVHAERDIDLPGTSNETPQSLLSISGVEEKHIDQSTPEAPASSGSTSPIANSIEDLPMQSRRTSRRKSLHEISNETLQELSSCQDGDDISRESGEPADVLGDNRSGEFTDSMKKKIFGDDTHRGSAAESPKHLDQGSRNMYSRSWSHVNSSPRSQLATPGPTQEEALALADQKKIHRTSLENVKLGHPLFQRMQRKRSAVTLLKERGQGRKVLAPNGDRASEIIFNDVAHGPILNPHCWVRKLVDYSIYTCVIYTLFAVPIAAGFSGSNDRNGGRDRFMIRVGFELGIDLLFLLDILLEFFTAVYDVRAEGYILDKSIVREGYMNTHFYMDLFSSFPFELLIWPVNIHYRDVVRLAKITRVTRLRNLNRGTQSVMGRLQSHLFRLIRVIMQFLWLSHIIACLFFGLARLEGGTNSWIYVMHIEDDTIVTQYLQSLFYSVTLTTGIGNTPVPPQTDWETIYVILAMIVGAGFWAYVMGIMFDLVSSLNRVQNSYEHDLDQLSYWMDHKRVPGPLKELVYRQFKFQHTMTRGINDGEILSKVSPALQTRLRRFLCRDIVATVPIFKGGSASFIDAIVTLLKPRFVITGDVICSQNEVGNEMYVIARGRVEVLKQRPTNLMGGRSTLTSAYRLTVLEKGSFFGEISLLYEQPRLATCRALTPCDLFTLSKGDFESVMLQHPEELRKMNLVATERHKATTEVQEQMKSADFETGDAIAKLKGASNSAHDTSGGDDISAVKKERRSSWGRGEKSFRKSGDADDAAASSNSISGRRYSISKDEDEEDRDAEKMMLGSQSPPASQRTAYVDLRLPLNNLKQQKEDNNNMIITQHGSASGLRRAFPSSAFCTHRSPLGSAVPFRPRQ